MSKRLGIAVVAGALVAAMLPGVTSAAPPLEKGGPIFKVVITCEQEIGPGSVSITGPAGWAQYYAHKTINESFLCLPGTKSMTMTKLQ